MELWSIPRIRRVRACSAILKLTARRLRHVRRPVYLVALLGAATAAVLSQGIPGDFRLAFFDTSFFYDHVFTHGPVDNLNHTISAGTFWSHAGSFITGGSQAEWRGLERHLIGPHGEAASVFFPYRLRLDAAAALPGETVLRRGMAFARFHAPPLPEIHLDTSGAILVGRILRAPDGSAILSGFLGYGFGDHVALIPPPPLPPPPPLLKTFYTYMDLPPSSVPGEPPFGCNGGTDGVYGAAVATYDPRSGMADFHVPLCLGEDRAVADAAVVIGGPGGTRFLDLDNIPPRVLADDDGAYVYVVRDVQMTPLDAQLLEAGQFGVVAFMADGDVIFGQLRHIAGAPYATVNVRTGGVRLQNNRMIQTVQVSNPSGIPIPGPIAITLSAHSPESVLNHSGINLCTTPLGAPYVSSEGDLAPGGSRTFVFEMSPGPPIRSSEVGVFFGHDCSLP